eukprot:11170423-Lingulodinium_polyedra.AAC.1
MDGYTKLACNHARSAGGSCSTFRRATSKRANSNCSKSRSTHRAVHDVTARGVEPRDGTYLRLLPLPGAPHHDNHAKPPAS